MGAHAGDQVTDARAGGLPDWAVWAPDARAYTLGVEEEVMLIDPADWSLAQRIDDVLRVLPEDLRHHVGAETHQGAVELTTDPHATVSEVTAQLGELRGRLVDALATIGLTAAGSGTHPSAVWSETEVTEKRRYDVIHETMRDLASREPTYALHVHVGVPDPDRAIALYNRLRAHTPTLLALSGNSPFWQGRDAGFASTRTLVWKAFPRTGMPRRYASYEEWVEAVDLQIRAGALPEPTFLWWDVRPQPRYGTVELRVMDAQSRVEDTAALVALVQSVARLELEEGYVAEHLVRAEEVLAENRFIAARDGAQACLIDTTKETMRPLAEILDDLLEAAAPHAEALGCAAELARVPALAAATGAARQRGYEADAAGLDALVEALAAGFRA